MIETIITYRCTVCGYTTTTKPKSNNGALICYGCGNGNHLSYTSKTFFDFQKGIAK